MVFGFFKKKKPKQTDNTQNPVSKEKDTKNKKNTPLPEKGSPKAQIDPHASKSPKYQDATEDQWIYDSIVQFLQSPIWQVPIMSFFDENCILFDNPKVNKPEYAELHNDFKNLVHRLVEDMLNELEIAEEKFLEVIQKGVQDTHYKKLFQQFFNAENYELFKKIMFKKNKELELEAMQQLNEIDKRKTGRGAEQLHRANEADLEKLMVEKEEAEIEHALALSLAIEEERQKLIQQEDDELQEALRQSAIEYSTFQKREQEQFEQMRISELHREREIEAEKEHQAKELAIQKEKQRQKERELEKERAIARANAELEEQKRKAHEIHEEKHVEEIKEEEKFHADEHHGKMKLEPLRNVPKASSLDDKGLGHSSIFPPLKGSMNYDSSMEQVGESVEYKQTKVNTHEETLEERKKRLQAQRDLILAKKKAEREAALKDYEEKKAKDNKTKAQKVIEADVSLEELKRRKEIYGKLKSAF